MRPINISLGASDPDGIATVQDTVGAVAMVLDGALVSGGIAYLTGTNYSAQYKVSFTSANNNSAINLTISGFDAQGNAISEVRAGPNANTVFSVKEYARVTSIVGSNSLNDVSAGIGYLGSTIPIPLDQYLNPFSVTIQANPGAGGDITVQYTLDPIFDTRYVADPSLINWIALSNLTNVVTNPAADTLIAPVTAVRFVTNIGTSNAITGSIVQAGAVS